METSLLQNPTMKVRRFLFSIPGMNLGMTPCKRSPSKIKSLFLKGKDKYAFDLEASSPIFLLDTIVGDPSLPKYSLDYLLIVRLRNCTNAGAHIYLRQLKLVEKLMTQYFSKLPRLYRSAVGEILR